MSQYCFIKINDEKVEAEFMGIFQRSNIIEPSPMRGGHPGGVWAYPVAVVKVDGLIKEVKPSEVTFIPIVGGVQ